MEVFDSFEMEVFVFSGVFLNGWARLFWAFSGCFLFSRLLLGGT